MYESLIKNDEISDKMTEISSKICQNGGDTL